jgi:type IV pilus assembly protein PilB
MSLVDDLVKSDKLSKKKAAQLKKSIESSKKREEEVILDSNLIAEEDLFNFKAKKLGIPFKKAYPEDVSLKVLELVPEDSAKYYKMIALARRGDVLEVGMVYPENLKAKEALKFLTRQEGLSYEVSLISLSNLKKLLKKYKNLKEEVSAALGELEVEKKPKKGVKKEEIKRMAEKAPISKIVSVMLRHAVDGGASDIHIEPITSNLKIRYRMLGKLYSSLTLPLKVHPAVVARIKILSELKIDETRVPQDGRFSARIGGRRIDFRVSTFPTSDGEKVVIRILDPKKGIKDFEELGLVGRNFNVMEDAIKKPYGMILVTGPTGSGKTTTLYSVLRLLNTDQVNIITLEDPIEYHIEGINQSQVKPDIGYDFATGLRHIMRQDPDIIMVGEIRDEETAALAVHSALTGHLVLSTLHTNDALGVIPRLVDMGVEPFLIPSCLNIALAQRLVRTLCPDCKKKVKASKKMRDLILEELKGVPEEFKKDVKVPDPLYIYKSQGCKKCEHTGFVSRIGIFEVLGMTPGLKELVLKTLSSEAIRKEAEKHGRISMRQDGVLKVLKGQTTIEEVLRVTKEN